ncbi:MAG: HAD family hydrolase [Candidatus Aenigmarchaeota archaeon]|nr:HAD family hydrolase [Candidatus Aenigmarchaeota archaeon]
MAKPKLFIFDVDGSFRDSSKAISEGISSGFISIGQRYPYKTKEVWNLMGVGKYNSRLKLIEALYAISMLKKDINEILSNPDAEKELDYMTQNNLNDADRARIEKICEISTKFLTTSMARQLIEVYPYGVGAIDLLKSKNYKVAILTNSGIETVRRDLNHLGLEGFSGIVAKEDLPGNKPSGEGIKKLMDSLGMGPEETLHTGDSAVDIRAAKDAGCLSAAILCGTGLDHHLRKENPDHIFQNVWDLSKHFCRD